MSSSLRIETRKPLQNRVAPDGSLHAVAARGLFTGNRGIIHDPDTRRLNGRRWTTRSWIVCTCDWKGRRRDVWGRNGPNGSPGWSELFFLDEVTALAAGHRPCFFCRKQAANAFATAFARGNGLVEVRATGMDARLHSERTVARTGAGPQLSSREIAALPDGAMVGLHAGFFARQGQHFLRWDFGGYGSPLPLSALQQNAGAVVLVTPPSSVAALVAGFRPRWHDTAAN